MRPVVQTVRGATGAREPLVDRHAELGQREAGIFPRRHAGGAGMVLLADEIDLVLPDADDGGHHADRELAAFERVALLDMRLQISDVASRLGGDARAAESPMSASASRMVRPLVRSRAASMSASVTCPTVGAASRGNAQSVLPRRTRRRLRPRPSRTDRH